MAALNPLLCWFKPAMISLVIELLRSGIMVMLNMHKAFANPWVWLSIR